MLVVFAIALIITVSVLDPAAFAELGANDIGWRTVALVN